MLPITPQSFVWLLLNVVAMVTVTASPGLPKVSRHVAGRIGVEMAALPVSHAASHALGQPRGAPRPPPEAASSS